MLTFKQHRQVAKLIRSPVKSFAQNGGPYGLALSVVCDVRTRIDILHFRFAGIDQTAPSAAKRLVEGDVIGRDCHAALQQGIFWRFFWTLALTIAGVILVVVAISTIFGLSPPKGAAQDLIETAILDSAATVRRSGRILSGEPYQFDKQPVDLVELVNAIVEDGAFEGQTHGVVLEVIGVDTAVSHVNGELIYVPSKTEPGGKVVIRTAILAGGKALQIRVEDTGPGLPDSQMEAIFRPFVRAESTGDARAGVGLGLTPAGHRAAWRIGNRFAKMLHPG
eukprot:gene12292-15028_t